VEVRDHEPDRRRPLSAPLAAYESVASDYAEHFRDELAKKPFDREMLDRLVDSVEEGGVVCDMGCGPGQIARYLADRGAARGGARLEVCGVDMSPAMVREARRENPDIPFSVGDMLDLRNLPDGAYAAIAAFYAIVHFPRALLGRAFSELARVLRPRGRLLLAFHIGRDVIHRDEWWGKPVDVDFYFFETAEIERLLSENGFAVERTFERDPYPDVEYPSRRAYVFAGKI
jgi:SAM-dependent methyltransferase